MKKRLVASLLFLAFFVALPMEKLAACGGKSGGCCSEKKETKKADSEHKSCGSGCACSGDHSQKPCSGGGGHCGGGHCGCGVFFPVGASLEQPIEPFSNAFFCAAFLKKRAFYFTERQPEAVVLPIWQPPQLVA